MTNPNLNTLIGQLQTPGYSDKAIAARTRAASIYMAMYGLTSREHLMHHLYANFDVIPSYQRLRQQQFIDLKTQVITPLWVRTDGQVLYQGQWWERDALERISIREYGRGERLGAQLSPKFGGVPKPGAFTDASKRTRKR